MNLTEVWAIGDADLLAHSSLGGKAGVANTPVHKNVRVFGYFDGHSGSRKVTAAGTYDQ